MKTEINTATASFFLGESDPHNRGPLRNLSDVELITTDCAWYNQQRLMDRPDAYHPPKQKPNTTMEWAPAQPAASQNPQGA